LLRVMAVCAGLMGSGHGCLVRLQLDEMVCSLERDATSMLVGESAGESGGQTLSRRATGGEVG
jgi:hypothetical protein